MPLKIQRSIMRMAERVLGLTGQPLPSEILERVQIGLEARAVRPWEFFDEGILPFLGRAGSPGVAGEFSYSRLSPRALASKKGDLVVITKTYIFCTVSTTIRVNSSGVPDATTQAMTRDSRIAGFTAFLPGVDCETGAEAAATSTILAVFPGNATAPVIVDMPWVMNVSLSLAVPSFPNYTVWAETVNTALQVSFEGFYIPATR